MNAANWFLAFDASCAKCRHISAVVAEMCDGKLEVLPLRHPEVERWRAQALGAEAPWAPTLLAVGDHGVRGWTGPGMVVPLVRRLGIRSTTRLLRTLGSLPSERAASADRQTIGRKGFLKLGAGLAAAAGLVLTGKTPALAEAPECAKARAWVEANQDRLPQTYADFAGYPMAYRQAIYAELPAATRAGLWTEHLARYRSAHPGLTAQQRKVLNLAGRLAADAGTFTEVRDAGTERRLTELKESAIEAFGPGRARAIIATLGPSRSTAATPDQLPDCECSALDDWCWGDCVRGTCEVTTMGCGAYWLYNCTGLCYG